MATIIGNAISVSINNKIVLSKNQHDWKLDEHGFIIGEDGLYYQRLYDDSNQINLNPIPDLNSQWVIDTVSSATSNEDPNYNYYMSNSNYHVNSSFSQFKVTWKGLTSITFLYRSTAESDYDYIVINGVDKEKFTAAPSYTTSGILTHTRGLQSTTYKKLTVTTDENEHFIWFCYIKDSSSHNGLDRAFVGIPNNLYSGELFEKQGSLLPSIYEQSTDVRFDGTDYRYIKYKRYILPDGSKTDYVYDDYIYGDSVILEDAGNAMYIEALEDNGVFKIVQYGVDNRNKSIKYMKNSPGVWLNYTMNQEITLNQGDKIYLMSEDTISMAVEGYSYYNDVNDTVAKTINCSIKYKVGGNAHSLLNYSSSVSAHAFEFLFYGQKNLIEVSKELLPATTLANDCYASMFKYCSSLVTVPNLPATKLVKECYYRMFSGCTSLVNAPALPATKLIESCYMLMFSGCRALVNAPALPATTLTKDGYYSMFEGCTSLVNAPALPATALATNCYSYMFKGCTSLVNAPALPATTLATNCYSYMFQDCTSLVNAPALPATTLASDCYKYMFNNCSKLKEIYCNARYSSGTTEITSSIGNGWLYNVPNTTDCKFHKNPDWLGPTARGVHTIPSNWQIVNWTQDTM